MRNSKKPIVRENIPGANPNPEIHSPGYQIKLSSQIQEQADRLLARFEPESIFATNHKGLRRRSG